MATKKTSEAQLKMLHAIYWNGVERHYDRLMAVWHWVSGGEGVVFKDEAVRAAEQQGLIEIGQGEVLWPETQGVMRGARAQDHLALTAAGRQTLWLADPRVVR